MKTLNRWKSLFSTAGFGLLILLFFQWLMADYSIERIVTRRMILCIAVVFLVAALVLGVVKKAIEEERERD